LQAEVKRSVRPALTRFSPHATFSPAGFDAAGVALSAAQQADINKP
jgi:hypothetical protein